MSFFSDIGNAIAGIFGGNKKETVTTTTTQPTTQGVVVTDFHSGESVQTNTSNGSITKQTYTPAPTTSGGGGGGGGGNGGTITLTPEEVTQGYSNQSIGQQNALALTNRPGGLVDQSTVKLSTNEGTLKAQLDKTGTGEITPNYNTKANLNAPTDYALGTLIVTPNEAKQMKGSGVAYWELSQTSNFQSALDEATFAQNVPYISKPYSTTGTYEVNLANIYAGQQAFKQYQIISTDFQNNPENYAKIFPNDIKVTTTTTGSSYQLQPSFWDKNIDFSAIQTNAQQKAIASFNNLPVSTQTKLQFQDFIVGGVMAGIAQTTYGIKELTYNALQGTFKTDAQGNLINVAPNKNSFERTYGNYPTAPQWIDFSGAQKVNTAIIGRGLAILPPLVEGGVSAFKNIKGLGFSEGFAQTVADLSPFKIKEGVFAEPLTSETKFTVNSVKYKNPEGITTEIYKGTSESGLTKIAGYSVTKGDYTSGFTVTSSPMIEIRAGGGIVEVGNRFTYSPYKSEPSGIGKGYLVKGNEFLSKSFIENNFNAGTSRVTSAKGFTIYSTSARTNYISDFNTGYKYSSGSLSEPAKNGITKFVSGRATPEYKTNVYDTTVDLNTGQTSKDFIRSPSGKYKVNPQIAGKQYDLNKIYSGKSEGVNFKSEGSGSSGTYQLKKINSVVNLPVQNTNLKVISKPSSAGSAFSLGATKKITINKTKAYQIEIPKEKAILKSNSNQVNVSLPKTNQVQEAKTKSGGIIKVALVSASALKSGQSLNFKTVSASVFASGQGSKLKYVQLQKSTLKTPRINTPQFSGFDFPINTEPGFSIPALPLPYGMAGGLGIGEASAGKSKTSYVPSFRALFFQIRGKKGSSNKTGLDFRPITPEFSYQRKVKRLIKIRI